MRKTRVAIIRVAQSPNLHLLWQKKREKTREHQANKKKVKTTQHFLTEQTEGKCKMGLLIYKN